MANSKNNPSSQPSMLSTLLFCQPSTLPKKTGRVVRFDEGAPDISYTTGSMRERVLNFLKDCQSFATSSEIAKGIASNPSRTTKTLTELVKDGLVESIKLEGCVREYQWLAFAEKSQG